MADSDKKIDVSECEKIQKNYAEPLKEYKSLLRLKKTVIKTRVNRINAANRLLSNERFLQYINIYYSCYSACIAILGLVITNKALTITSTILTVILAISIVFLNAQKYGSRSQELKNNYIALHGLLYDIELAEACNDVSRLPDFTKRYCKLLQTSENHSDIDYLRNKKFEDLTIPEILRFYGKLFIIYGIRVIFIVAPFLISKWLWDLGVFKNIFN